MKIIHMSSPLSYECVLSVALTHQACIPASTKRYYSCLFTQQELPSQHRPLRTTSRSLLAHRDRLLHKLSTSLQLQHVTPIHGIQHPVQIGTAIATQTPVQRPPTASTAAATTSVTTGNCTSLHPATAWPWYLTFKAFQTTVARHSSSDTARQLTGRIKAASSAQQLLQLIKQHGADMNHIHVSAMYTTAKALFGGGGRRLHDPAVQQKQAAKLLQQMEQLVEQVQQQCTARQFANISWSCGYLSRPGVVSLLLPCLLQPLVLQQAEAQHLSNTLLGVAKSGAALAPDQLQQLLSAFSRQLADAKPQNISNTLWAVATVGQQVQASQLQQLLSAFSLKLADAKPQEISNTLWAVATMGLQVPAEQLQQLLSAFSRQLADAKPQNISNTLWAVATMQQQVSAEQLQQLLSVFSQQLVDAKPQAISNTLWAVATMGQQIPAKQLQQLLTPFSRQLADLNPQDVSNTLWAVATMGHLMPMEQLQGLVKVCTSKLDAANMQAIANTMCACAKQQYVPKQLLAALEQRQHFLQQQFATTAPMALSGITYACGQLGYCSQLLPGALLQAAANRCRQEGAKAFRTQELANLCWSAAVLDLQQYAPQVLELAAACSAVWGSCKPQELQQLYQVHLWLLDCQVSGGLSGVLTPQQLQQCRKEWELAADAKASKLQQQVFAAVQQLPPGTLQQQPVMEQRTADGAFSIDIAVTTAAGSQVAIEVDGPSHFLPPGNTLDGPTRSTNRALAARGWSIVSVLYFEWTRLKPGQQQQAYLLAKLQVVPAASGSEGTATSC